MDALNCHLLLSSYMDAWVPLSGWETNVPRARTRQQYLVGVKPCWSAQTRTMPGRRFCKEELPLYAAKMVLRYSRYLQ